MLSVSTGYVPPLTQVSWDKLVSLIGKEAEETDGRIFVNENLSNTVYIHFFATFHELFFLKIPLSVEIFGWVEESNLQPKVVEAYFNVV